MATPIDTNYSVILSAILGKKNELWTTEDINLVKHYCEFNKKRAEYIESYLNAKKVFRCTLKELEG